MSRLSIKNYFSGQARNRRKLDHYKQERESFAEEKKLEDDKLKVLSHRKFLENRFAKVNFCTNPSTYSFHE